MEYVTPMLAPPHPYPVIDQLSAALTAVSSTHILARPRRATQSGVEPEYLLRGTVSHSRLGDLQMIDVRVIIRSVRHGDLVRIEGAEHLARDVNHLWAIIDWSAQRITFGPPGQIMVESAIRGSGAGSYLLSTLINHLQLLPVGHFSIRPGTLSAVDASLSQEPDNAMRRDAFYRKHGFCVSTDADGAGSFYAACVSQLHAAINPQVLTDLSGADSEAQLLSWQRTAIEDYPRLQHCNAENADGYHEWLSNYYSLRRRVRNSLLLLGTLGLVALILALR
jgi:hypothetical protein